MGFWTLDARATAYATQQRRARVPQGSVAKPSGEDDAKSQVDPLDASGSLVLRADFTFELDLTIADGDVMSARGTWSEEEAHVLCLATDSSHADLATFRLQLRRWSQGSEEEKGKAVLELAGPLNMNLLFERDVL